MSNKNKNKIHNIPKRYVAIVKIKNNDDGSAHCVKYRFNNLIKFTKYLDENWSEWKWFNLFSNRGRDKGSQLGSFTQNNRPVHSNLR